MAWPAVISTTGDIAHAARSLPSARHATDRGGNIVVRCIGVHRCRLSSRKRRVASRRLRRIAGPQRVGRHSGAGPVGSTDIKITGHAAQEAIVHRRPSVVDASRDTYNSQQQSVLWEKGYMPKRVFVIVEISSARTFVDTCA